MTGYRQAASRRSPPTCTIGAMRFAERSLAVFLSFGFLAAATGGDSGRWRRLRVRACVRAAQCHVTHAATQRARARTVQYGTVRRAARSGVAAE